MKQYIKDTITVIGFLLMFISIFYICVHFRIGENLIKEIFTLKIQAEEEYRRKDRNR